MTDNIGLTPKQLIELTGYTHVKKQLEALVFMDIPFRVRPQGSIFVHVDAIDLTGVKADPVKPVTLTIQEV